MPEKLKLTMTAAPSIPTPNAPSLATSDTPDKLASIAPSLAHFDTLPESAHVRLPVVAALHGVGPATVWRWVRSGRLPAPVKLGPNTTAWRVGELRRVMAEQV
jgi:predicted DNA-binding transcriptional regulator AlpA